MTKDEKCVDSKPEAADTPSPSEPIEKAEAGKDAEAGGKPEPGKALPYVQNRELSWLAFNERCLDQGADKSVPPLERLKFVSIFWSNLQEFFMVRVGSLTDLSLLKKTPIDTKSQMTPIEQIDAIHKRCHELYPIYERTFAGVEAKLADAGIRRLLPADLNEEQRKFVELYAKANIVPFLAPQVVNVHHPFPHLETGALYVVSQLSPAYVDAAAAKQPKGKDSKKNSTKGAPDVTIGIIPVPSRCDRVIPLPGDGYQYILAEHVLEMIAPDVFSMYRTLRTNIICVTRNADLDATEGLDEEVDFREHMKKILKKRGRLAPVRLDAQYDFSTSVGAFLLDSLNLTREQFYFSAVPLNMGYAFGLPGMAGDDLAAPLSYEPFEPAWSSALDRNKSLFAQIEQRDVLLTYPYESMDPFLALVREAVFDPEVVAIKITLYRLATKSHLAELLISAAEAGKDVTLLFELRARFDEGNNIEWSQRCEDAGCKVVYGFRDYKVHSKLCLIVRKTAQGMKYITQVGTGNYNEKTATLYTDYSFMTADERIGRDAVEFFQNVGLEAIADTYEHLRVAPIQIKRMIMEKMDEQMALAKAGEPCGVFVKTNSITDLELIRKISEASCAGVPVTMFVRGISCLVPGVPGYTENVRVVSVVGRLLEHSRVYAFGPFEPGKCDLYISSADFMTRNMDRRVEVACPIYDRELAGEIIRQVNLYLSDTVKLRELQADRTYTPLGAFAYKDEHGKKVKTDAQEELIAHFARAEAEAAAAAAASSVMNEDGRKKAPGLAGGSREEVDAAAEAAAAESKAAAAAAAKAAAPEVAAPEVEAPEAAVPEVAAPEVAVPEPEAAPEAEEAPEVEAVPAVAVAPAPSAAAPKAAAPAPAAAPEVPAPASASKPAPAPASVPVPVRKKQGFFALLRSLFGRK